MSQNLNSGKFAVAAFLFLCFHALCLAAGGEDLTPSRSPLWQKIEDARVYMSSNRFPESRVLFEQALDMAVKERDEAAEAICIGNLGTLCDMTDKEEDAISYYKKGYDLALRQKNNLLLSKFAGCLVRKYAQRSEVRNARKWLDIQEALPPSDDPNIRFYSMYDKASVLFLENDPVLALHYIDKACKYADENDLGADKSGGALMAAGDILYKMKRYEEAIETYQQGLAKIKKGGNRAQEIFALRTLYVAYKHVGDSARARKYREQYNLVSDSMYDGMTSESAGNRLDEFEKKHNRGFKPEQFNSSFFLICIIVVLLGIVAFVAVALHKLARRQKKLLDSNEMIIESRAISSLPAASAGREEMKEVASAEETPAQEETGREITVAQSPDGEKPDSPEKSDDAEDAKSPLLTYEQQKILLEKIDLAMENVSLISREDFNLAMLAKAVNSNTKYVSKVINDLCGKTFKTYLNEFRIREACRRLTDRENFGHLTIKAIHQELGFRTTTSFVAAFRRVMGMTPSEYKKLHGDNSEADDTPAESSPSGDKESGDLGSYL